VRVARVGGRRHRGQDIFAPRGTPIRSATAGVVVGITDGGLGGKAVWILGAGGRRYYYAHLDRYGEGLQVGDVVTTETIIGYVGNTGVTAQLGGVRLSSVRISDRQHASYARPRATNWD
jgi:murein DD-endopeptidase MepM/ murein hydrolase activator NlpD